LFCLPGIPFPRFPELGQSRSLDNSQAAPYYMSLSIQM
jgi:hypothetical protein